MKEYSKEAEKYDLRHEDKCYKWESKEIIDRINNFKKSKGNELLDVGCGTGSHLFYLQNHFDCTGIDLHQEMLNVARKKLKSKVKLMQGNMINFNLNKEFDVIICMYSAINYSKNNTELTKTLNNFYKHLKNGGVCIIEPYYTLKVYKNFSGKNKNEELILNDIKEWSKIMRNIGFKVKYFYRGLHCSAKGVYVLTKK